jgi:glucose/arabinose dehydrogenase
MLRNRALTGVAGLLLLATTACGAGAAGSTPSWVPQQDYATETDPQPQLTVPNDGGATVPSQSPGASGSAGATPSPSTSGAATDPTVVATGLNQPTGLIVMPDGTALVGERTTGRILRVQPKPGQPAKLVQTLTGIDAHGDGGLLDLALSPTYAQDGLIYAYLSTATDNRVIHFTLGATPTPVITGIPHGARDNAGRIAFDATGALLVGTGDAGQPGLAESPTSLAGKILRTNDIGQPASDNPVAGSPVFASGLRTVDGLCVNPTDGSRIAISAAKTAAPATADEVDIIKAGADYGWPSSPTNALSPAASLPTAATGGAGCAVLNGQLAIATTTGKSVVLATLGAGTVSALNPTLTGTYGRLRTAVAASDGALWLTTSNRDGLGKPVATDDRVIRIDSSAIGGSTL